MFVLVSDYGFAIPFFPIPLLKCVEFRKLRKKKRNKAILGIYDNAFYQGSMFSFLYDSKGFFCQSISIFIAKPFKSTFIYEFKADGDKNKDKWYFDISIQIG